MPNTTIPNKASDAGPEPQPPMGLTDLLFEIEWRAEQANNAHKRDQPAAAVRIHLEAAREHIERALGLL